MEGFIKQIARTLYKKYGDDISSLRIVFPGRRARLFFTSALSEIADEPLWQPTYITVDDLMHTVSGLRQADSLLLMAELYKVYSSFHDESFDDFYFWGEILLADFNAVDKYMVDAAMLFTNISNLKNIEADLSYLSPEERALISRFWSSFGSEDQLTEHKQIFGNIWNTILPVYHKFRENLRAKNLGYAGMIHRDAAEKIARAESAEQLGLDTAAIYSIAGFNALTTCEKKLFDFLAANFETTFFWDYDDYYLDNPVQEAGIFMRENLKRYPQSLPADTGFDAFVKPKDIRIVNTPSDPVQARYSGNFLKEVIAESGIITDKETAIVLTDEELLIPVLHSIPSEIPRINVTMGYPLKMTSPYTLVERIISLQAGKKVSVSGELFYHTDVTGILRHPMLAARTDKERIGELLGLVTSSGNIYIDPDRLSGEEGLPAKIFVQGLKTPEEFAEYLLDVFGEVASGLDSNDRNRDYIDIIVENVRKLRNSVDNCGIRISLKVFQGLLRKVLRSEKIPFEGEPLAGIQVMGILETRNLDFRNVMILSMTDDSFPGKRIPASFIPHNLRYAYGLPTQQYHESMYAYDFYRLIQRAQRIDLVYSSKNDEKSTGEPSRYIHQLEYESTHALAHKTVVLNTEAIDREMISVEKTGPVMEILSSFTHADPTLRKRLSPTALYNYIVCPLKFYYYSVARLSGRKETEEEIDAPLFGTIFHSAAQKLYSRITGKPDPGDTLLKLKGSPEVIEAVELSLAEELPSGIGGKHGGNIVLIRDVIVNYLNNCLLSFDGARFGYTVRDLEKPVSCHFRYSGNQGHTEVTLSGFADRIDILDNGVPVVVDYKTGRDSRIFRSVPQLFSPDEKDRNSAVFQILLYCLILKSNGAKDAVPALYFIRNLNAEGYSPLPESKAEGTVANFSSVEKVFSENLTELLKNIFDPNTAFTQCEDQFACLYCDFNTICRRG